MEENNPAKNIQNSIQQALQLPKCRKCGCLQDTLDGIIDALSKNKNKFSDLWNEVESSTRKMEPIEYT